MFDLFNPPPDNVSGNLDDIFSPGIRNDVSHIHGLTYIPNYITAEEERKFIHLINSVSWLGDIKRRVQHYGYKYDYKARSIDLSMYIAALPDWINQIAIRLHSEGHISEIPDQVIINEYKPGQGIANHIDCEPCFGDTIISLSLASHCVMDFIHSQTKLKTEVMLEPRNLVVIKDEARYKWSHGIAQRKTDTFNGAKYERDLRISMTFRKVILKK